MKVFAHDTHVYPLPAGHRFPLEKYALLRARIENDPRLPATDAPAATWDELERAHDTSYLARVRAGELSEPEQRALGLPWSPALVERARRSTGATIAAARVALIDGCAGNLGGGTHHAAGSAGRGFCVFNDVVVALRVLRGEGLLRRALVVDLDVHQGDGTHALLAADPDAFTVSVNGLANYPYRRVAGDLEFDFRDGTTDEPYLAGVERVLTDALRRFRPDIAFYLGGADPYEGDRLGRLSISKAGLAARDELVAAALAERGVPVCVTLAGGYAEDVRDTVEINERTIVSFARA